MSSDVGYYKGYELYIGETKVYVRRRDEDLLYNSETVKRHLMNFKNQEQAIKWIEEVSNG